MNPSIEYIPDASVTEALDSEIRALLTTCFTKPHHVVFKERRYFKEPYPHRWVIRDQNEYIIAHIGVHEKQGQSAGRIFPIGGIAEVCMHPDYRGRGYVKLMLKHIHGWLKEGGFVFSLLFGNPIYYSSSGYVQVDNLFLGSKQEVLKPDNGMIMDLSGTPWPAEEVYIAGPKF